jgi:hypothetical protein|nr:MAG TPA: L SHAPED TAIL FIBER PROTEIN [Caudoviricetes sp.]
MDIEIVEVQIPKAITAVDFIQGLKGDRGISITDFTLDDDGNAVTTFENGETKKSKLTSIASASESAKKAAISEANAKGSADNALASETNAKTSETNAGTSAENAKASEVAAKLSETNAKDSETAAKSSEEVSSTKADEAAASATSASDSAVRALASEAKSAKSAESAEDSYNKTVSIQSELQTTLDTAKASETAAKASEVNAKASETASADSASKAHTSELNAKASETSAATSAGTATTQASNASSSATTAKNWAVATTSPDGAIDADSDTGKTQSSRSWALMAKASAESASSSASMATTQASSATASAKSASESATSASGSATSASSSATNARNSASAAATSATNASNSETQASGYKTAASNSATAAASSATSASTSATNAKAAMNTANTAASSASTSATSASTSASNASKSEVAAKTAQAAAEKARDDANSAVSKLTGVMKYAGQVDDYSDLADVTKNKGDVWNIVNADSAHGIKAGDNVAWNGTDWDNLSGTVDLSIYAEKADYQKTITSATANGATITFNHKDGTTSTATVNNVASATAATNDAKGQKIDTTYEKVADASNVHTSLQNSINSLSSSKQDKLAFDSTPTANSTNPVTSGGVKTYVDNINSTLNTAISKKADSTDILQADWNTTDTTLQSYIKNKPESVKIRYSLDLSSLDSTKFYPVVFDSSDIIHRCEIYSQGGPQSIPYNCNIISFSLSRQGWQDVPYSFTIEHYNCYDNKEITIGCIGSGNHTYGCHVVWLRGSLYYTVFSNIKPTLHTSDYTNDSETYTVGTNYYGGSGNANVNIFFTPQKTISSGPWHDGKINGLVEMAKNDINGNAIVATYATKTEVNSKLPLSGGTMTGALNFANYTWNLVGDDAYVGDHNLSGTFCIKGANGTTGIALFNNASDTDTDYARMLYDGTKLNFNKTLGANISGNAATATKLATARTISLTGNASGSATFDGSGNISIDTTVAQATKATQDASGNVITSTYATKDYVQQLMNTLSTVSVTQDSLTKALSIK